MQQYLFCRISPGSQFSERQRIHIETVKNNHPRKRDICTLNDNQRQLLYEIIESNIVNISMGGKRFIKTIELYCDIVTMKLKRS